jgi:hypothetical protein
VKSPRSQFTLGELMGLVALCALGTALLKTSLVPLGVGVLVILPGFVLERARGGSGIIGGIISGCALPVVVSFPAAIIQLYLTDSPTSEYLNLFPALYLLLVICLVWSSVACSLLYVVDRWLQGPGRSNGPARPLIDPGIRFLSNDSRGIRFLPDDDRPRSVSEAAHQRGESIRGPERGADR